MTKAKVTLSKTKSTVSKPKKRKEPKQQTMTLFVTLEVEVKYRNDAGLLAARERLFKRGIWLDEGCFSIDGASFELKSKRVAEIL